MYDDDIVLNGNDVEEIEELKKTLATAFEVKELDSLRYFLRMEIARSKKGISVSQQKYTLDLLKETKILGAKPSATLMDPSVNLEMKEDGVPADVERYKRLVGKLIYLSHTRPDISYAVGIVSQFSSQPQEQHMEAIYTILRYLKMTPGRGIFFCKRML